MHELARSGRFKSVIERTFTLEQITGRRETPRLLIPSYERSR